MLTPSGIPSPHTALPDLHGDTDAGSLAWALAATVGTFRKTEIVDGLRGAAMD